MLNDKVLLVTGGTGSFGKRFIRHVLERFEPKKVIIYSRDELKQFEMQHAPSFRPYVEANRLRFFIGDVRDLQRLTRAMETADVVVHAAALKQVPACEYNPFEAVKTNVMGGQNVIDAALATGVRQVVALSTDKAAAPINLYGATKLTSDKLFVAANNFKGNHDIRFSVVRYGNVMGSRGSVIPFFMKQKALGVLPVTDARMTRFNITLAQGVEMVLMALERMWGGELYVPKIPSYRILDLAEAIAPECKTDIVGIRPGEKLHEEMITETDSISTMEFDDYYVILPSSKQLHGETFRLESGPVPGRMCEYGFSYNSGNNPDFLSVADLRRLIDTELTSQGH